VLLDKTVLAVSSFHPYTQPYKEGKGRRASGRSNTYNAEFQDVVGKIIYIL
jgi:hypothetical protein